VSFAKDRFFWFSSFALIFITSLVYLPLWNNDFITSWDDRLMITDNVYIRSFNWSSIHWMWTTFHTGNWIPLTWMSLALDYQIGSLDPRVFHFTNLFFHIANAILVLGLCRKFLSVTRHGYNSELQPGNKTICEYAAFLTAIIFAIHPIHVESVAWAAERKDVLYAFFFLSSLWVYLNYAQSAQRPKTQLVACWILFVLSLMSKPMAVTLPVVLLIFDFWPLRRFYEDRKRVLIEKVPFFLTSLCFSAIAVFSQSDINAIAPISRLSIHFRVINAFRSLAFYLWKMTVPYHLVPLYSVPRSGNVWYNIENYLAIVMVLAISLLAFVYRKQRPYLVTAWLCYVVMLVPVIGLLQVGNQAAADRYTYLPSLPFFLLLSILVLTLVGNRKLIYLSLITIVTLGFGWLTLNQLVIWKNSITLWEQEVTVYPDDSSISHTNLAFAYMHEGRLDDALHQCDLALAIPPPEIFPRFGRGEILFKKGLIDEAIIEIKKAIEMDGHFAEPHQYLWSIYRQKGMKDEALMEIKRAIELEPDHADYYGDLAFSLRDLGRFDESEDAFKKALSLGPNNLQYIINLGRVYEKTGHLTEALEWFKKGLAIDSNSRCWFEVGNAYFLMGRFTDALTALQTALKLDPTRPEIQKKLAETCSKINQTSGFNKP
jgi:protein O-mannosyl-transferase